MLEQLAQDAFDAIEPQEVLVSLRSTGEAVSVKPLTISQIAKVSRALKDEALLMSVRIGRPRGELRKLAAGRSRHCAEPQTARIRLRSQCVTGAKVSACFSV